MPLSALAIADAHLSEPCGGWTHPAPSTAARRRERCVSVALGTRLPLLIYRIPGIRLVQNTVYRWVADHRYRFPGKTPYCESHPVAC